MKKIISILLALTFIFTYPSFSFAQESENADITLPSASGLLSSLGIMNVDETNYDTPLTRQEFAKIIFKLITNSDLYNEDYTYSYFSDVTDPDYTGYVNEMARLKVINGYSDGTFRPLNEITLTEAVTFIIRAIGYDIKAEASGGYPTGYLQEAKKTGILRGVSTDSGETLKNSECIKLIKNTLLAKLERRGSYSADGTVIFVEAENTILNSVHGIDVITDVVKGIDLTKLSGESTVQPWHILIGEKELDIGKLEPREFLGMEVEAYYTIDDDTLVHIEKTDRNNIVTFDVSELYSVDTLSNVITQEGYYKNTEHKYGILTDFIYNYGISESPFTIDMFNGKQGTLTLIDNNSDKIYDVVKADVYYDIVCDYVDLSDKLVYDLLTGNSYNVNTLVNNPFVEIFDTNGEVLDITDIDKYNILSVYETLPEHEQKYVKFIVSKDKLTVKPEVAYYNENNDFVVLVNEEEYIFTDTAQNLFADEIDMSKKQTFLLNFEGYVVSIKEVETSLMQFGVLVDYYTEETSVDRTFYIKYMNQSGSKVTANLKKWVTIDNIKYKNDDLNLLKHLDKTADADFGSSANCRGTQVIKYQLDSNGNIAYIDTIAYSYDYKTDTVVLADEFSQPDTYNSLRRGYSNSETSSEPVYLWGAKSYDGKVFVGSNTLAFIGPYRNINDLSVYKDFDNYKIGAFSGAYDHYSSYFDSNDSYLASLVFLHRVTSNSDGSSGYNVAFSVFDKYTNAISNDGESGYKIYYWEGKSYKSTFASKNVGWTDTANKLGEGRVKITPDKLKQGDVLRFSKMSDGSIAGYKVCYRADGDIFISQYDTGNWYSSEKMFVGYLYRKYGDGASLARLEDVNQLADDSDVIYFSKDAPVLVYNPVEKEGKRLEVSNLNSGQYYVTDGLNASRVVLNTKSGTAYAVYIIRR